MKLSYKIGGMVLMMFGAFCTDARAQLKESVDVEGKYNKEILYPDRLGRLPERRRLTPPGSSLPYSFKGVAADFVPSATPLNSTDYGARRPEDYPRGYLSLSAGSWLNAGLSAGYAVIDRPGRSLNIWLRHSSTSLWKPFPELTDNKRFSYQETVGADWSSRLGNDLMLSAGLRYHAGYFNYYGVGPVDEAESYSPFPAFPTQTLNDLSARVALSDNGDSDLKNRWNSELEARHFAFRTATRETSLKLGGAYARVLTHNPADVTSKSVLGFDGAFQWLFYGAAEGTRTPDGYGNFRLSPFYRISRSKFSFRAGFNADFTFKADVPDHKDHYSLFHISPDFRIDYSTSKFAVRVHATGGQQLQTLGYIADCNLYCYTELQSTTPVYIPVDASVGIRVNPFAGFSIEGWAGYRVTRNVRGDGWTIPLMNSMLGYANSGIPLPVLGEDSGERGDLSASLGLGRARYNLSGLYAGASMRYELGKIMNAEAKLEYAPQSAVHGIYNGLDRPRWLITPKLNVHPVDALTIGVSYEYRGVRSVWSAVTDTENLTRAGGVSLTESSSAQSGGNGGGTSVEPGKPQTPAEDTDSKIRPVSVRLPDITRLNVHAAYRFEKAGPFRNLTLGVTASNILNQKEVMIPGLRSEGLTVSGSVSVLF